MSNASLPKILVVNDDPGSLIGLVGLLSQWTEELSFEVVSARSGEEALRHVLKNDFAVILLDVNMPGMNGFEAADAIHSRKASASTPIIFVTAYLADEMNRLKGYEQGAADYLFTPIIPQVLKAKLSVFVALARQKLTLKHQADVLDQRAQELTAINSRLEAEIGKRKIAEEKTKSAEEFLAMLGHELRNPLAAVSTAATLLGFDGVSAQQTANALKIIQRQTGQLTRIVEDLLDLGRVMAGKIILSRRPVDLSQLVQTCVETLASSGRTHQHVLNVQVETGMIDADPSRMEQIVTNLLDNALKYTPAGGHIAVEVKQDAGDVILSVRDSGIGMSAELLSQIFNIFVQGEQPLDRPQGGLGIGLALVRQLVTLHGGTVTADSNNKDKGSVFVVRLPGIVAPAALNSSPAAVEAAPLNAGRIVLIDDNDDSREITAILLASLGHQVFTAPDGISGIQTAFAETPSVALIDIGLPGIDGYEVARRLRADSRTSHIKLIAVTGYGSDDASKQALHAGFDLHLVKPVPMERLTEAINTFLDKTPARFG
ncbi:response regulator [Noviherbaspirillum aerium]|uniref:response regulator n=1 Tax=Noviherbaspirillum aerium TaxID=2588497 RepID=UPI00124C3041|nr:response regulator [Noviherbaspirillum aerium]